MLADETRKCLRRQSIDQRFADPTTQPSSRVAPLQLTALMRNQIHQSEIIAMQRYGSPYVAILEATGSGPRMFPLRRPLARHHSARRFAIDVDRGRSNNDIACEK